MCNHSRLDQFYLRASVIRARKSTITNQDTPFVKRPKRTRKVRQKVNIYVYDNNYDIY